MQSNCFYAGRTYSCVQGCSCNTCQRKCNICQPESPKTPNPVCCENKSVGIQVALQNTESEILAADGNIVFDTIVNGVGQGINYNLETGEFLIKRPGNYNVNWQISVEGSDTSRFINIGVKVNDESQSSMSMPMTAGTFGSAALISTQKVNTKLSLFNNTGDTIRLSRNLPNANIVITSL